MSTSLLKKLTFYEEELDNKKVSNKKKYQMKFFTLDIERVKKKKVEWQKERSI